MKCKHCTKDIEVYDNINEYPIEDGTNLETWEAECPNCGQKYILKEVWKRINFELTEVQNWHKKKE